MYVLNESISEFLINSLILNVVLPIIEYNLCYRREVVSLITVAIFAQISVGNCLLHQSLML